MLPLLAVIAGTVSKVDACSRVFWNSNKQAQVVARTMDLYMSDEAQLVFYPRGMERAGASDANAIRWKAPYASVAVTAFGMATSDGLNEHGLAVHLLYLHDTKYELRDQRPALSNTLSAQYVLDNSRTVLEALKNLQKVQIVSFQVGGREWPLHLAIEDASGDSAIIEFVDGKEVVHHGKQFTVMTNEPPLQQQLENLAKYKLFGGKLTLPGDIDPASRYVRAATFLKTLPEPTDYRTAVAGVLGVIRTTMVPMGAQDTGDSESHDTWPTLWVSAADLTHRVFYFHSTKSPNLFWIDLKSLDPAGPSKVLDPCNPNLSGEVGKSFSAPAKSSK
jgi:choloylglycine hydrolase